MAMTPTPAHVEEAQRIVGGLRSKAASLQDKSYIRSFTVLPERVENAIARALAERDGLAFKALRVEIARLRADLTTKDEELRVLLSGTVEGELRLQLASSRQEIERLLGQRDAAKRVVEAAQAVKARSRCTSGSIFVEPPTEVGATAFWLAIRDVHAALAAWREGRT